jgi:hypothetical protein
MIGNPPASGLQPRRRQGCCQSRGRTSGAVRAATRSITWILGTKDRQSSPEEGRRCLSPFHDNTFGRFGKFPQRSSCRKQPSISILQIQKNSMPFTGFGFQNRRILISPPLFLSLSFLRSYHRLKPNRECARRCALGWRFCKRSASYCRQDFQIRLNSRSGRSLVVTGCGGRFRTVHHGVPRARWDSWFTGAGEARWLRVRPFSDSWCSN